MLEPIKKYWRYSLPGAPAIGGIGLWGWETFITNQGGVMTAYVGLWVGLFFLGWLIGLIWADQTRVGSFLRRRLSQTKKVEPELQLRRSGVLFAPLAAQGTLSGVSPQKERDEVYVLVGIRAHSHKDFSNVQSDFVISMDGRALSTGRIFSGDLNRGKLESTVPISLICDRSDSNVWLLDRNLPRTDASLQLVPRGQRLAITISCTARGISVLHRDFTITVRNDPFGRLYVQCPDGEEHFVIAF